MAYPRYASDAEVLGLAAAVLNNLGQPVPYNITTTLNSVTLTAFAGNTVTLTYKPDLPPSGVNYFYGWMYYINGILQTGLPPGASYTATLEGGIILTWNVPSGFNTNDTYGLSLYRSTNIINPYADMMKTIQLNVQ